MQAARTCIRLLCNRPQSQDCMKVNSSCFTSSPVYVKVYCTPFVLSQRGRDMTQLTQTVRCHFPTFASFRMLSSSFECAAVFELQKKFANEYNMLCLHVWMLLVRLRSEGKDGKDIAQMVYETFQDNVEARVRGEGVKVSFCLFQCKWHWKPC